MLKGLAAAQVISEPPRFYLTNSQVELREAVRVLTDLAAGGTQLDYPYQEVRDITDTWRCVNAAAHLRYSHDH